MDRVPRRTVQFGVISTDRADSRAEAERGLDTGDPTRAQSVSVIDSVITPGVTRSEVVRLSVGGLWQRADDLYAAVRPRWEAEQPDEAGTVVNDRRATPAPSGSWAPCRPACARPRKRLPRAPRGPTHATATCTATSCTSSPATGAGSTRSEAAATGKRACSPRATSRTGSTTASSTRGGREVDSFQLWTVFPADADAAGASDAPVLPLAFEFRPRKYLELKARRNPPPAQGTSASTMMEHGQR